MAVVNGTDDWELIVGSDSADTLSGGRGADTIHGLDGNDTIYGNSSDGRYFDNEPDVIDAGAGNDDIFAGIGDRVLGGDGDDDLVMSYRGEDRPALTFEGGEGFDTLTFTAQSVISSFEQYVVMMDEVAEQHPGADVRLFSVERLDLGGLGGGHVIAGSANNHITVSYGQDIVEAGGGDDTVAMRLGGDDVLKGEAGEDTLSFEPITSLGGVPPEWGLMVKLHETGPQNYYFEAYDPDPWPQPGVPTNWAYRPAGALQIESFEHFIGSSLRDAVEGSAVGNRLDGRAGNDDLKGLSGTDTLLGGTGDDTLDGGADNDLVQGEEGRDKLYGGDGADSLDGGAGTDTLYGGEGADTLNGGADLDVLDGGAGNDLLDASLGGLYADDTLSGGEGNDTLLGGYTGGYLRGGAGADHIIGKHPSGDLSYAIASYIDSAEGMQIDRRQDSNTWSGDAKGDVLVDIHRLQLSTHDDVFYGRGADTDTSTAALDEIWGAAGHDTILGLGGNDLLYGEGGNDSLSGGHGTDRLRGGDGADHLDGGDGRDEVYGGAGNDTMMGGQGDDFISDYATGDSLLTIDNDVFNGGEGNDHILLYNGADTAFGGEGDDIIEDGNVSGKVGHLHLEGGSGDDHYYLFRSDFTVVEELSGGRDTIELNYAVKFNGEPFYLAENVENLIARSMFEAINAVGNVGDNDIIGSRFNDTLMGGYGNDVIKGHLGNDFIDGGFGTITEERDIAVFSGKFSDYKFVTLENGDLQVTDLRTNGDGEGVDVLRNIERLRFQDVERDRSDLANTAPVAKADALMVDEDATTDNLYGLLLSNDTDADGDAFGISGIGLAGTKGTVVYDAAAKKLTYAADADVFDDLKPGETATDTFTYTIRDKTGATSTATVTMTIVGKDNGDDWINLTNGNDSRQFTHASERIRGLDGNDDLKGASGNDTIDGGVGNDTIDGESGVDKMLGGQGDDRVIGGLGDLSLAGDDGVDTGVFDFSGAQTGISFMLPSNANASVDVLGVSISGFERMEFTAGSGADYLQGGTLADVLRGGGGNDTLIGGGGTDQLHGGAGDDNYYVDSTQAGVFENAGDGVDTVQTTLATYFLGANVENLTAVISSAGRSFTGNALANRITGGAGADTIDGGAGADILVGGAGKDRFVFTSLDGDQIQDWQKGEIIDVMALEAYGLRLTVASGATRVDFDIDGDGQFDDGQLFIQSTTVKITDFDW